MMVQTKPNQIGPETAEHFDIFLLFPVIHVHLCFGALFSEMFKV